MAKKTRQKLAADWLKIWRDTLENAKTDKDRTDAEYWIGYFYNLSTSKS